MTDLTPAQKRKLAKIQERFVRSMQPLVDKGITVSIIVGDEETVVAQPGGEGSREQ